MNLEIYLIPAIPAFAAALLSVLPRKTRPAFYSLISSLSVLSSFALTVYFGFRAQKLVPFPEIASTLMPWIETADLAAMLAFRMDSTAFAMCLLVSGMGSLIIVYSAHYLKGDENPGRYFAAITLFAASMLFLVLAENLLLLFIGWEGVGLCSYLLIGHYWKKSGVPLAAFRAFFVNRAGDLFFLLGVFTLFQVLGTVSFTDMPLRENLLANPAVKEKLSFAALLLLGGAFAKSAQIPLHVWLPDAMAGPTPVSALIHAATMVTAGVYLVIRLHWLFLLSAQAESVLLVAALLTFLVGAVLACFQTDIKKILAYSTISNLGLMFLALAARMPAAAFLHLFGHAAFKALLFLGAGAVIIYSHHEQDIRHLKGILKKLPVTRGALWIGAIGGAGFIPYAASGFFSKEMVLHAVRAAQFSIAGENISGETVYWIVYAAEFLSIFYLFRMLGYLEAGRPDSEKESKEHDGTEIKETGWLMPGVLFILSIFSVFFGIISAPGGAGGTGILAGIESGDNIHSQPMELSALIVPSALSSIFAAGIFLLFMKSSSRLILEKLLDFSPGSRGLFARNFYFDDVYGFLILRPLNAAGGLAYRAVEAPVFLETLRAAGYFLKKIGRFFTVFQRGILNEYAFFILIAALLFVIIALFT